VKRLIKNYINGKYVLDVSNASVRNKGSVSAYKLVKKTSSDFYCSEHQVQQQINFNKAYYLLCACAKQTSETRETLEKWSPAERTRESLNYN